MELGFLGFIGALIAVELCRRASQQYGWLDSPNARSSHTKPTSRLGGLGVVSVCTCALAVLAWRGWNPDRETVVLLLGCAGVACVGLIDDLVGLGAATRFALQIGLAVGVVVVGKLELSLGDGVWRVVSIAASVMWLVWLTNLFNFMDGSDGLAATQAIIGLFAFAELLPATAGAGVIRNVLGGALAGFLVHNTSPARIFMGDSLSTSLGFLFGGLGLLVAHSCGGFCWQVLLPIYVFLFDATITLVRRFVARERWWSAHRTHGYQLMLQLGWSHRSVQMFYGALAAGFATLAVTWVELGTTAAITLLVVANLGLGVGIVRLWRRWHATSVAS